MTVGLIGRKCGMTRVFTESGETVPVTVLEVAPNYICQIKLGATSSTVTGTVSPDSVNTRVIPHFRPISPTVMIRPLYQSTTISTSTPAAKSSRISASTVLSVGPTISTNLLWVLIVVD